MSWWLFIPAVYFALAADFVCPDLLSWRGVSPKCLVLLWSVIAMRARLNRTLPQSLLIGVLHDLIWGMPLGFTSALLVSWTWLSSFIPVSKARESRLWIVWGGLLLLFGFGSIHIAETWSAEVLVKAVDFISVTMKETVLTYVVGLLAGVLLFVGTRLIPVSRSAGRSDLEASQFFLSR